MEGFCHFVPVMTVKVSPLVLQGSFARVEQAINDDPRFFVPSRPRGPPITTHTCSQSRRRTEPQHTQTSCLPHSLATSCWTPFGAEHSVCLFLASGTDTRPCFPNRVSKVGRIWWVNFFCTQMWTSGLYGQVWVDFVVAWSVCVT